MFGGALAQSQYRRRRTAAREPRRTPTRRRKPSNSAHHLKRPHPKTSLRAAAPVRAHAGGERAPSAPNALALRRPSRVVAAATSATAAQEREAAISLLSKSSLQAPCSLHLGRRCSAGFHDSSPPTFSPNEAQASRPPACRRAFLHHRHGRAPPNTAIHHERPQTRSAGMIVEPLSCRSTGRCSRERWAAIAGVVEVGGDPPPLHTPVPAQHHALPLRRRG